MDHGDAADEDPRGRPVVLHAGPRADGGAPARRRSAVARAAAAAAVVATLAAGTTVVVSEVLTPAVPEADRAPLWFRPPPRSTTDAAPAPAGTAGAPSGRPVAFDERPPTTVPRPSGARPPQQVRHAEPGDDHGGRTATAPADRPVPRTGDDHPERDRSGHGPGNSGSGSSGSRSSGSGSSGGGHSGRG